jgi:hypothetical protein
MPIYVRNAQFRYPARPLLRQAAGDAGDAAALWVADVDNPQLFAAIIAEQGIETPWTRRQETGRGGFYLLFAAAAG